MNPNALYIAIIFAATVLSIVLVIGKEALWLLWPLVISGFIVSFVGFGHTLKYVLQKFPNLIAGRIGFPYSRKLFVAAIISFAVAFGLFIWRLLISPFNSLPNQ